MNRLDSIARVAALVAAALLCAPPTSPAAAEGSSVTEARRAVECHNLSGMAIITCLQRMTGSEKDTRMWLWSYINGRKTSHHSKALLKLNMPQGPRGKPEPTRVGVYCYLHTHENSVVADMQQDLGGQGVDAARAKSGLKLFLKELLEAVKHHLKVKTNPAHAKLLHAQPFGCQRELSAALGLPAPATVAAKPGSSPAGASTTGSASCPGSGKDGDIFSCEMEKLAVYRTKGLQQFLPLRPAKLLGNGELNPGLLGVNIYLPRECRPGGTGCKVEQAVVEVTHRSRDRHGLTIRARSGASKKYPPNHLYKVRFVTRDARTKGQAKRLGIRSRAGLVVVTGWVHGSLLEPVDTSKCEGGPRWEAGILSCPTKPYLAKPKCSVWARNHHWVNRFGVAGKDAKGRLPQDGSPHALVLAHSLTWHFGNELQAKVQLVEGKRGYVGWIPRVIGILHPSQRLEKIRSITKGSRPHTARPIFGFDPKGAAGEIVFTKETKTYSNKATHRGSIRSANHGKRISRSKRRWSCHQYYEFVTSFPPKKPRQLHDLAWVKPGTYKDVKRITGAGFTIVATPHGRCTAWVKYKKLRGNAAKLYYEVCIAAIQHYGKLPDGLVIDGNSLTDWLWRMPGLISAATQGTASLAYFATAIGKAAAVLWVVALAILVYAMTKAWVRSANEDCYRWEALGFSHQYGAAFACKFSKTYGIESFNAYWQRCGLEQDVRMHCKAVRSTSRSCNLKKMRRYYKKCFREGVAKGQELIKQIEGHSKNKKAVAAMKIFQMLAKWKHDYRNTIYRKRFSEAWTRAGATSPTRIFCGGAGKDPSRFISASTGRPMDSPVCP